MPSNMIINTESVVGYNNKLMKATGDMKFGVNNSLNTESKPVGISHNMGSSKVKLPHSVEPLQNETKSKTKPTTQNKKSDVATQHEINILTFIIISGGFGVVSISINFVM